MIFVTGGTGLVGSHLLLEILSKNQNVRALKRENSSLKIVEKIFNHYQKAHLLKKIEWVNGDLLDSYKLQQQIQGCTSVYHAAAFVSFHPKDVKKMMSINIDGTANLVNICLDLKVKKLAYVSSISTLSKNKKTELTDENCYWIDSNKKTNYALSKYLSEQEVWRGIQEGLDAVIINPSVILGPGDWTKGSSQLFTKVWKGLKYYTLGATAYVDVIDVAKSLVQLMESEIKNERFIISSENISYQKLFQKIAQTLHKKEPYIQVNNFIKEFAWRSEYLKYLITRKKPLLTKETANQAMSISKFSNKKISDLGITFIPIDQSIKKYGEWFLKEINRPID